MWRNFWNYVLWYGMLALSLLLKSIEVKHFAFQRKEHRTPEAVITGAVESISKETLLKELHANNIPVTRHHRIKKNGKNLSLMVVQLTKYHLNAFEILKVAHLGHTCVNVRGHSVNDYPYCKNNALPGASTVAANTEQSLDDLVNEMPAECLTSCLFAVTQLSLRFAQYIHNIFVIIY